MRGILSVWDRLVRQDALVDLGPSVRTWRLGDTNAAVVGPSVVIHVWAGSDADVESRVGIVIADAVVDVVCGADIVDFWRPEVGVGSVHTRLKASEVHVGAENALSGFPGPVYRGSRSERKTHADGGASGDTEECAILVLDYAKVLYGDGDVVAAVTGA